MSFVVTVSFASGTLRSRGNKTSRLIGHRKEIRKLTFQELALRRSEFQLIKPNYIPITNDEWHKCLLKIFEIGKEPTRIYFYKICEIRQGLREGVFRYKCKAVVILLKRLAQRLGKSCSLSVTGILINWYTLVKCVEQFSGACPILPREFVSLSLCPPNLSHTGYCGTQVPT